MTTQPASPLPGDLMIHKHLASAAREIEEQDLCAGAQTADAWLKLRPKFREQYLYMLGLWPLPEKTPLQTTVTGTLDGQGYRVDKLHFQSRPGLYVTANLYRPASAAGERLPAVLYLCGHTNQGRDGNKAAYQSFGIWFARHGYVCLVLDTLQLGEIAGIHHGTYRENRWWWLSRGYTPAGVECWNGIRAIDYLVSRDDVDPERIAVTGISGGGAATWWITAADDRVKVAVPVSGMADLSSYVTDYHVNGHCDCMFMYNTFRWPWARIAALAAPRPVLFANSDNDPIFPMAANERIINRLEQVYKLFGKGDLIDAVVSIGGHAYRRDLREATYRFINTHLKNDPRPVTDSEVDLVIEENGRKTYPIDRARLRVFPHDSDIPADQLNTAIDEHFVPMARVEPPPAGRYEAWRDELIRVLRRVSFGHFPDRIPAARQKTRRDAIVQLETEPGIVLSMFAPRPEQPPRVVLVVGTATTVLPQNIESPDQSAVFILMPRGTETNWTRTNPPNYVERSHYLLGRTVGAGQIWDAIAAARYLRERYPEAALEITGSGDSAVLAAYAALLEPEISSAHLVSPPASHLDDRATPILNVLRVCDIPEMLGALAPRRLTIDAAGTAVTAFDKTAAIYAAAGAANQLKINSHDRPDASR